MENEEITNPVEEKNPLEQRTQKLVADKKAAEESASQANAKLAQMEKENIFLNSFSNVTAKFPTASEYKDKIKEKVMSGYSVDDATVAVLHAENKLSSTPVMGNVAGGSATNQITQSAQKTPQEMSSAERWSALKEAEKKGDLGMS